VHIRILWSSSINIVSCITVKHAYLKLHEIAWCLKVDNQTCLSCLKIVIESIENILFDDFNPDTYSRAFKILQITRPSYLILNLLIRLKSSKRFANIGSKRFEYVQWTCASYIKCCASYIKCFKLETFVTVWNCIMTLCSYETISCLQWSLPTQHFLFRN